MDEKLYELMQKTNIILEKTKKQPNKYAQIRKNLLNFYNKKDDLKEWENYLKKTEEKIDRS